MTLSRNGWLAVFTLLGASVVVSSAGCGAGAAVRPKDPTFAGASGGDTIKSGPQCHEVGPEGSPLIVDWKPEERADLEEAMKKGVAVVHYDCTSFKLLPDCNPMGSYKFIGVTTKEQVISLKDADEAKANLPLNGGQIGASLSRGASIDVALMMVGKKSSPSYELSKDVFASAGKCEGATHFVRAATVGAFAMQTGTAGKAAAAGTIFGVGASAASTSDKGAINKDGTPEACKGADVDGDTPPKQCSAVLRIQLVAFSDSGKVPATPSAAGATGNKAAAAPVAIPADVSCPAGLVAVGGKCTPPVANVAHECRPTDKADCEAQCTAGDMTSCSRLGELLYWNGGPSVEKKALALFQKACDGGNQAGCTGRGIAYTIDDEPAKAVPLFKTGCAAGYADACNGLGEALQSGKGGVAKDKTLGTKLIIRACNAGSTEACWNIGNQFESGDGVPKDGATAVVAFERSCGPGPMGPKNCWFVGDRFKTGDRPFPVDKKKAFSLYVRACDYGDWTGCKNAGESYEQGGGVPADKAMATKFYQRACKINPKAPVCKKLQ